MHMHALLPSVWGTTTSVNIIGSYIRVLPPPNVSKMEQPEGHERVFTSCVCLFRCVLLFRPPRLNNAFEDNTVVFTDYLTVSSLRRFIRDHM